MKIYIATSGEYSDYNIEAVFTNFKQAMLFCATHQYRMEVYESDTCEIETKNIPKLLWEAGENWRGEFYVNTDYEFTFYDIYTEGEDTITVSLDWELHEGTARKILKDKYYKFKAKKENIR